jgi:hypothetical protein
MSDVSSWFGHCAGPPPVERTWQDTAWLVIGSIDHVNGIGPEPGRDWTLQIDLAEPAGVVGANTVWLTLGDVEMCGYCLRDGDGHVLERGTCHGSRHFEGMRLAPEWQSRLGRSVGGVEWAVPLFLGRSRRVDGDGWSLEYYIHLYTQVRFELEQGLFIRVSPSPYARVSGDGAAIAHALRLPVATGRSWLDEAVRLHGANALFLNNHQCYYKKCLDGDELEIKFTFPGPIDIWDMTVEIYRRIKSGGLPNYVPEFGDEFQKWDYLSHLFEVREPEEERGYIAFIPTTDGRYTVKRKWFAEDQLRRKERMTKGVVIDRPLADYLTDTYHLCAHSLGCLRRIRYDVNIESLITGHVYGIFFDHCSRPGRPGPVLRQCEIEYLRSRIVLAPDETVIAKELDTLADWVARFLDEKSIIYERGYYSKLSFLRECLASAGGQP